MDDVFKALADANRRRLLDSLNARNGQSLRELCAGLDMARQSVSKHLAVLEAAELVTTTWNGREKLHFLNVAPINAVADRWISRYHRQHAHALADLQRALEEQSMSDTVFVYTTYINTTPERLWQALTDPAFTRRYWGGVALESDWTVGSPVKWQNAPGEEFKDLGQVVLESDPYRRLSYSWHTYQPEHAELFGWSDEELAERLKEKRSKVTFDIEPQGAGVRAVKLTVTHDEFEPGSAMLEAVSKGWPELLASMKTLLETGEPLPMLEHSGSDS
ncbi:MarR family transcriptional regulator [Actinobacteria bacterium YIM 96077]|uniref:ArsR family transcriptional regulator n=1 Tax=Phytoactinopolyspora halophila TaxID=1981511 RepID=A0A329R1Z6_9ACTN|nr:SRPBCC domain-containing protein [Phytoactinopolyspora halophila]AYY12179.1 MarR family transcriptional regulator [Actinobacteria bacterium YIM 96077]RAW18587.1 ArsR family transcriptional regulator [Phytoactinopolyspora halophila]